MTVNVRCIVCKNTDMRRLIELGWNAKMSAADLAHAFGGVPNHSIILRHLKEHAEGAWNREIAVEDARPIRTRVLDIQRAQIEAIERRMAVAQQMADDYNETFRDQEGYDPMQGQPEFYFNILHKDMQSAISSILKAQGLTDKREMKADANKIDLFRLMIGDRGGLAPAGLIDDGMTVEGVVVEVPDVPEP